MRAIGPARMPTYSHAGAYNRHGHWRYTRNGTVTSSSNPRPIALVVAHQLGTQARLSASVVSLWSIVKQASSHSCLRARARASPLL